MITCHIRNFALNSGLHTTAAGRARRAYSFYLFMNFTGMNRISDILCVASKHIIARTKKHTSSITPQRCKNASPVIIILPGKHYIVGQQETCLHRFRKAPLFPRRYKLAVIFVFYGQHHSIAPKKPSKHEIIFMMQSLSHLNAIRPIFYHIGPATNIVTKMVSRKNARPRQVKAYGH